MSNFDDKPQIIKVNNKDNIAIIVNSKGIIPGTVIINNITANEYIPCGHKIALSDLLPGDAIIRYGEIIGFAAENILKGDRIDENKVILPDAPALDALPMATQVPVSMSSLEGYTFLGYKNKDGSVGTKNMLGITTCVQCVEGLVNIAVKKIQTDLLPQYSNVDGVIPINHSYGCGVDINSTDAVIPIRTLQNLAKHPNFGGELLVISLGCEMLLPDMIISDIKEENLVVLQNEYGFEKMIEAIMTKAKKCLEQLNNRRREVCPASDLVVGLQCGGSDAFSGITANPAVGYTSDLLVRVGATVLFSEVTEVRDAVHLLTPRCASEKIGKKLKDEMDWYDRYLAGGNSDRDANPSPGNKRGGLTNIVEKALGSIAKSGSTAIMDVLSPGEKVSSQGLVFAATPASDFICGTCQLASGITVQVFTTGRGTVYGLGMAPVIKVSTNTGLKNKWHDLIDIDAGKIAIGEATINEIGLEIFNMIIDVASGVIKTKADYWGIENAICLFDPTVVT